MKTEGRRTVYEDKDYVARYDFNAMHERNRLADEQEREDNRQRRTKEAEKCRQK